MDLGLEVEARILSILRRKSNYHKYRNILQSSFFQTEATKQLFILIDIYFQERGRPRKLSTSNLKLIIHKDIRNEDLKKECIGIVRKLRKIKTRDNSVVEEIIKDFVKRQLVKKGILEGLEELNLANPDFSKIHDQIEKAILISTATDKNFYDYFEDPGERMETESKEIRISTGIPKLDQALDGGMGRGELIVFLAPPERGKTLSIVNMGIAALHQGKKVGMITLELSERRIARRFDLRISGRPIELLRNDPSRIKNPLAALRKTGCHLVIKDYSAEDPTLADIESFIITYQNRMKCKFDLILVDYADLIKPSQVYKQERFALKEVYKNLRRFANELNIPIVTASQGNRKSMDKLVITMEDFDECFAKAGIADVILGICQTPEELEDELCRIYVAKNRSSGTHPLIRLVMKTKTMFLGEYRRDVEINSIRKQTVADKL